MLESWLSDKSQDYFMDRHDTAIRAFVDSLAGKAQERMAFLDLSAEEVELLKGLQPVIGPHTDTIVSKFYEHLLQYDEPRKILADQALRERLFVAQKEYLTSLFSGDYGVSYYESRLRIGFVHNRIRLLPKWYLGAYMLYITLLHPIIKEHFKRDLALGERSILALHKILNLDMQLAMDAYIYSSQRQLQETNQELEALNLELDERIHRRTMELVASERRYRSAIEASPTFIYQIESDGHFEHLNRKMLETLGYTQEELADKPHDSIVEESMREAYLREIDKIRETGSTKFETVLATSEGERVEVEAYGVLMEPALRTSPVRVYLQDLTERNRMHRQVQQAQKLAAIGKLSSILAHEVRNPLNAMGLHLTLLERRSKEVGEEAKEKGARAMESMRNELDRLAVLVDDFLLMARPSDIQRAPRDLHELIDDILQLELPRTERQAIRMVREFDKKMPEVPLDGDKIKQTLLNLVSNALDAMPDGGVLTVGTRRKGGAVIIEISDTGTGISPEVNVFELFFTTKSQGTGMGLNIVEGIVQQHGGHVEFSSVEGEGTTVSIDLPLDVSLGS